MKQIYDLINNSSLESKDVFQILKLDQSKALTLEDIHNYFVYKLDLRSKYSFHNVDRLKT